MLYLNSSLAQDSEQICLYQTVFCLMSTFLSTSIFVIIDNFGGDQLVQIDLYLGHLYLLCFVTTHVSLSPKYPMYLISIWLACNLILLHPPQTSLIGGPGKNSRIILQIYEIIQIKFLFLNIVFFDCLKTLPSIKRLT